MHAVDDWMKSHHDDLERQLLADEVARITTTPYCKHTITGRDGAKILYNSGNAVCVILHWTRYRPTPTFVKS